MTAVVVVVVVAAVVAAVVAVVAALPLGLVLVLVLVVDASAVELTGIVEVYGNTRGTFVKAVAEEL